MKDINTSRRIGRQVKKQQENNIPVNGVKVAAKFSRFFLQEDDLAFNPSVNIIFGADGIKHYFAKRSNVQEALEGLCYGFPHGGYDEPNEVSIEKCTGMDHLQLLLNRQYFQYVPNPYYCDVEIVYDRLNNLPQESSLW